MTASLTRRRVSILLAALVASLAFTFELYAESRPPDVREKEMRAELTPDGVTIGLPITLAGKKLAGSLAIELLDTGGSTVASASKAINLKQGDNSTSVPVSWPRFAEASDWEARRDMLMWTRVRYRLTPSESKDCGASVVGIRALGPAVQGLFTLRAIVPENPMLGSPAHIRVFAENPFTGAPVPGVHVEASVSPDDDDEERGSRLRPAIGGETAADGSVAWDLMGPAASEQTEEYRVDYKLRLTGTLGFCRAEEERKLEFYRLSGAIITTDKSLYQPGQPLHIRALVYDPGSRRPRPSESVTVKIEDQANKAVFERELKSDRFGVVATDWPIPITSPLGDYAIEIEGAGDRPFGTRRVRVSRYELPTFVTVAEPDKPFYLPASNAVLKVTAQFVYGEPVKAGHVRIAREETRTWNFQQQRWEVKEGGVWEGDCDADGAYNATIPLEAEHESLKKEGNLDYRDIEYVARYTEAASGRSEERRFRLRISKEPIHLFVFSTDFRQAPGLPLRFYVVANYADGRPAVADVTIEGKPGGNDDAGRPPKPPLPTIRARTDRHGVAMIENTTHLDEESALKLVISARDQTGGAGSRATELQVSDGDGLRLRTSRVLYHRGEPLRVEVQSTAPNIPRLLVEVLAGSTFVRSQTVAVRDGHANIEFAPGDDLSGKVSIVAHDPDEDGNESLWDRRRFAVRTVLYPKQKTLDLTARFDRDSVKPGELARAVFASSASDGRALETSLGVVVFDSAVEERARTESESGQGRGYFDEYYTSLFDWYASVSDVTLRELEELDQSKPFPADIELAADALLQRMGGWYACRAYSTRVSGDEARSTHSELLDPIGDTIDYILNKVPTASYPRDAASLYSLLSSHGVPLNEMTDMWGNHYRAKFDVRYDSYQVGILSDGPDEQLGTRDDFNLTSHSKPFFDPASGKEIEAAVDNFKHHRGRYPNSAGELVDDLRNHHAAFLRLVDPWGTPYKLIYRQSRYGSRFEVEVRSAGPDRRHGEAGPNDDVRVFRFERDWFDEQRSQIQQELSVHLAATQQYPSNEDELKEVLEESGIGVNVLRDPWDQPLKVSFGQSSQYGQRRIVERVAASPALPAFDRVIMEPVTRQLRWIQVRASLAPGETALDQPTSVAVAYFSQVVSEESRVDAAVAAGRKRPSTGSTIRVQPRRRVIAAGLAGAISGVITDQQGAVITRSTVTVTNNQIGAVQASTTDEEGVYAFTNLSPGTYSVRAEARGFMTTIVSDVEVRLSTTTIVDLTLSVASVSETVTVSGGGEQVVQTESASVSSVQVSQLPLKGRSFEYVTVQRDHGAAHTPRLRQDFPETLVWQPSLITDLQGKAQLEFKVADSITTWRMAVIGSTEDGLIGSAIADLRAVQPFFVEHQPPPSLTIGDDVETPVVVRNYSERAADVHVKLAAAPWMKVLTDESKPLRVESQGSATENISFSAVAAGEFKQEASAIGDDQGDRVAKPISVRFDGRDTWQTCADLFQGQASFDVDLPGDAIAGSTRIDLKLYADLYAHALEAAVGITQRPYGCIEQTTSAGYTNLIALQCLKRTGRSSPIEQRALRNLTDAVARIRSFAASDGAYSYFSGTATNIALTSYVLRFLVEAREFVPIDDSNIDEIRRYLIGAQRADGAWEAPKDGTAGDSTEDTLRVSALVVRALAESMRAVPAVSQAGSSQPNVDEPVNSLKRALDWLGKSALKYDDPYALATYAIAASESGRVDAAHQVALRLAQLGQAEAGALFWDEQTVTPFYGWGRAGRTETTGLVVEALKLAGDSAAQMKKTGAEDLQRTARRGLLFLVKSKDEYGVWYSTQATVNVLRALISFASVADARHRGLFKLFVSVDGGPRQPLEIEGDQVGPVSVDLPSLFPELRTARGRHRVLVNTDADITLSASIVARTTVPWKEIDRVGVSPEGALRLHVGFDHTELKQGETVTCAVHAERIGSAGYGMMLAEIGLPPGVDVDLASLRKAPVLSFDVTPDRVVVYLWPQAGGTDFNFEFRPRLRIKAAAQPAVLYDYYNPDSRVSVPPNRFAVR